MARAAPNRRCCVSRCHEALPILPAAQRGDTSAALPLYERALAIWEAAGGPHSPDVAHTLTDIAVIHLEAVRIGLFVLIAARFVVHCFGVACCLRA